MPNPPKALIIGRPVKHARSPLIHAFWLEKLGIPGSYERADVMPGAVKAFLRELYVVWRHIEDLPIYKDYASAKLGYTHDANLEIYKGWGVDVTKFLDPEDAWVVESYPDALKDYVKERDVQVGIVQNEVAAA